MCLFGHCAPLLLVIALMSYASSMTTSTSHYRSLFEKKNILILGDGDFSFTLSLMKMSSCKNLLSTTMDTQCKLESSFAKAASNVQEIIRLGGQIEYEIDATKMPDRFADLDLDIILWNFPHIPGKQNIKYNRELIQNFLDSSKKVITKSDQINTSSKKRCVVLTLCEGQSGLKAKDTHEWNHSWKLSHIAAEAGFLIVENEHFDIGAFEGYEPQGHRGHGKGFHVGVPEKLVLSLPNYREKAVQAPLYVHEVHILAGEGVTHMNRVELEKFEQRANHLLENIFREKNWNLAALWSMELVDVYKCPTTLQLSLTLQIGYCSIDEALGRECADKYREYIENELPSRLMLQPRSCKHGGRVSFPYAWYVTKILPKRKENSNMLRINDIEQSALRSSCEKDAQVGTSFDETDRLDLTSALRKMEISALKNQAGMNENLPNGDVNISNETVENTSHSNTSNEIKALARSLWKKRVGVLIHTSA